MGNWKYDLGEYGEELRAAIDESEDLDGVHKVCEKLKECAIYLKESLKGEDKCQIDSINDFIERIDGLCNGEYTDYNYEDLSRHVDFCLDDFYDLCDLLRVWIAL